MREVQASETDLHDLIAGVENGEEILILRDGRAVARIVPEAGAQSAQDHPDVFGALETFRQTMRPTGITIDEILACRHEGHRR